MADNTNTALISFRKNLRGGRRCSPEDLEALGIRIALGQQADCPSRGDGPTASGPTEDIKKIFESLQHARMRPTAQDLVETRSIPALTTYCGLELVKVYDDKFDKLELAVGKKKYTMPKLERPTSYAKELTLGRGRISTVYLPRIHAEDNCVVYAREMFCLFAMAEKSSRECPEDQYLVSALAEKISDTADALRLGSSLCGMSCSSVCWRLRFLHPSSRTSTPVVPLLAQTLWLSGRHSLTRLNQRTGRW